MALSYGGKDEIVRSVNRCIKQEIDKGDAPHITEKMIEDNLDSPNYPKIDLMIRTSGEERISNFMLWQLAYSELYFTDVMCPDFSEQDFIEAVKVYSKRNSKNFFIKSILNLLDSFPFSIIFIISAIIVSSIPFHNSLGN